MIRAVGVGMNQPPLLEWFVKRADLDCVLVAGRYSLLDTAAASSLLPYCQRHGPAVLAAGAFNSGILADPRPGATYDYVPADYGPATADLLDRARAGRRAPDSGGGGPVVTVDTPSPLGHGGAAPRMPGSHVSAPPPAGR